MSTSWHLRCSDCNRISNMKLGGTGVEAQLQAFLDNWEIIHKVYDLTYNEVSFLALTDMASEDGILRFMDRHDGHNVLVENEYGKPHSQPETILEITERNDLGKEDSFLTKGGYVIKTTRQEIVLAIGTYQSCCENWGYFLSEDDLERFIGAELLGVQLTDTMRKKIDFEINTEWGGDTLFVDLITNKGILQFVAYNQHNGYYGHEATVTSTQLTFEAYL